MPIVPEETMIGKTLSHYRVTAALGKGGMGEVWRATDERLGRDVALKVLPEEFAREPERLARFEREAKVLAKLNHPNIATLFGLESVQVAGSGQTMFLAMELVEGEDLAERLMRGAIPVEEAIAIALQIAEALEAAHEMGIVHRDVKPANIMLRSDGTAIVLDFGLAKPREAEKGDSAISMTVTKNNVTTPGVIIGTAAYMSPEQAAGIAADGRADIWALGVVLWEMLTGRRLFAGETVSLILAAVIKDEVNLEQLPPETPPRLRQLIGRCLRKQVKQRLQSIGDVRIELEECTTDAVSSLPGESVAVAGIRSAPLWRRILPWATTAVLAVALGGLSWSVLSRTPLVISATIPPPQNADFNLRPESPGPVATSPDGRSIAFSARDEDERVLLYLRRLASPEAQALSGTDNAAYPFWSPDSRWVGFFDRVEGSLKKIDTNGGPPILLCEAPNGKGATWSGDGVIVFAPGPGTALYRVSSAGGTPTPVTELTTDHHNSHRYPHFLPDGQHFLYLARGNTPSDSALMVADLESGTSTELMAALTQAEFASGHLLFVRERALMAQRFDLDAHQLEGEAVPLAQESLIVQGASLAVFSASENGVLTFGTGQPNAANKVEWWDRTGTIAGALGDEASYRGVALSPDGRLVAASLVDSALGNEDLWIFDTVRSSKTRFTFNSAIDETPVWSPDGLTLYFASNRDGDYGIYRKSLAGAAEAEVVFLGDADLWPSSLSPDGRHLLVYGPDDSGGTDISLLTLKSDPELQPYRQTEFGKTSAVFSPDGRWVAYSSDESGRPEIYVAPFPGPGRRWQVSTDSGVFPTWRSDGQEIVYVRTDGSVVAVKVSAAGGSFRAEGTEELFPMRPPEIGAPHFSMSGDGQRFLVVSSSTHRADALMHLLINWPTALEARR